MFEAMYDCPHSAQEDPQYVKNILEPLENGEGVACFVVDDGVGTTVLYCSHRLTGEAEEVAIDDREAVRAAQAVAIQREAREQAEQAGFHPVVA